MPVGPTTLWPVKARKSAPAAASTSSRPAAAAPPARRRRRRRRRPRARGGRSSATGLIVPSMFDTQVSETTLVRSVISSSMFDRSSRPSSVSPNQRSVGAGALGEQLPRHDVGVVLHLGDDDLVALADLQRAARPASVFATRLSASVAFLVKTTSSRLGRVDERRDLVAGALERLGRLGAELVHGAGDVGVVPLEVVDHRVDHDLRLLRGVGAVEVDQRQPARERALEDREVLADDLELRAAVRPARCGGHGQTAGRLRYLS